MITGRACVDECEAAPICTTCHLRKPPRGRSVAPEMANGMCGYDCRGYLDNPKPGHLWPGELKRIREESP